MYYHLVNHHLAVHFQSERINLFREHNLMEAIKGIQ